MKSIAFATLAGAFALIASHAAEIGKPAPDFSVKNTAGAMAIRRDGREDARVIDRQQETDESTYQLSARQAASCSLLLRLAR